MKTVVEGGSVVCAVLKMDVKKQMDGRNVNHRLRARAIKKKE